MAMWLSILGFNHAVRSSEVYPETTGDWSSIIQEEHCPICHGAVGEAIALSLLY